MREQDKSHPPGHQTQIMDFGIAWHDEIAHETLACGTRMFSSPEQTRKNAKLDGRSGQARDKHRQRWWAAFDRIVQLCTRALTDCDGCLGGCLFFFSYFSQTSGVAGQLHTAPHGDTETSRDRRPLLQN